MWRLWLLSKTTGQRPSDLLGIRAIGFHTTGMPDDWAALNFDLAVSWFGHYVEAKLHEFDDKTHKPLYSLEGLLSQDSTGFTALKQFASSARGMAVYHRKKT